MSMRRVVALKILSNTRATHAKNPRSITVGRFRSTGSLLATAWNVCYQAEGHGLYSLRYGPITAGSVSLLPRPRWSSFDRCRRHYRIVATVAGRADTVANGKPSDLRVDSEGRHA